MDRIWQWAWDRYGARYTWAIYAISFMVLVPNYIAASFLVVAFEKSGRYVEAATVTVVAVLVLMYVVQRPGSGAGRLVERWAAGHEVDQQSAVEATYTLARGVVVRAVVSNAVWAAALLVDTAIHRHRIRHR